MSKANDQAPATAGISPELGEGTFNPDYLAALRKEHGEIIPVELDPPTTIDNPPRICAVFKRPGRFHLDRLAAAAAKKHAKLTKANEDLLFDRLIYPSRERLSEHFERWPGLSVPMANTVLEHVGFNWDFNVPRRPSGS